MLGGKVVKRKKIKGIKQGKHNFIIGGQKIKSMVYIDYKSLFIMVKGVRMKVNYSKVFGYYMLDKEENND